MSSSNTSSVVSATAAEFKTWIEGRTETEGNEYVLPHVAYLNDPELIQYLNRMHEAWERARKRGDTDASNFYAIPKVQSILRDAAGLEAARAVQEGNASRLRAMVGDTRSGSNASQWDRFRQFQSLLGAEAFIAWIFAESGAGKTNFVMWMIELWRESHRYRGQETEVASNLETFQEQDLYIDNFDELVDWIDPDSRSGEVQKFFLMDDVTQFLKAKGNNTENVDRLEDLLTVIRKGGGNAGIIGHRRKAAGPGVREQASVVIQKTGKRKAEFYENVDGEGEPVDRMFALEGIPPTGYTYDDKERGTWDWCEDSGDDATARGIFEDLQKVEDLEKYVRESRRPQDDGRLVIKDGLLSGDLEHHFGIESGTKVDSVADYILEELNP